MSRARFRGPAFNMRYRWLIALVLALVISAAAYFYWRRDLPLTARSALRHAEQFELLSLNPNTTLWLNPDIPLGSLYNHEILGRTTITDPATRQQLTEALRSAARQSDGAIAACLMPRHGIRVTRSGQVTDFVICFECSALHIHTGGKLTVVPITRSAEPIFDAACSKAGMPLAEKSK